MRLLSLSLLAAVEFRFSKQHGWVSFEPSSKLVRVGITEYGAQLAGPISYVDLPEVEYQIESGEPVAHLECSTAASEPVASPVSGQVMDLNTALLSTPNLVNSDPYKKGFLMTVRLTNPDQLESLMTASEYQRWCQQGTNTSLVSN